jgi:CRISPR/Cas system-associated exonuclease Cas4 (RecB family)
VRKQLKFTSWSWSRYYDYKLCPLKAKLNHLDKIREPKNDAMARGGVIHDTIRDYIRGVQKSVKECGFSTGVMGWLNDAKKAYKRKTLQPVIEEDWAFTKDWTQTQWNDWVNCVLRVKLDAGLFEENGEVMVIIDWKSGKFRPEEVDQYVEQLELQALAALVLYPQVREVRPQLRYVDFGLTYPAPGEGKELAFTQADVPKLKKLWDKRTKPMLSDTRFAPRPNDKCRWCFYGQSGKIKGGPGLCKF